MLSFGGEANEALFIFRDGFTKSNTKLPLNLDIIYYRVRVRFLRGLLGEDKPSPLLCYESVAASSIVGAMACPRPARAAASFTRICARCQNRMHTQALPPNTFQIRKHLALSS